MYQKDTIAAIATGMSNGGIGIIRISGQEALDVAERVFYPKGAGKSIRELPGYSALFGEIRDGKTVVDEAVCLVMLAPNSYTTENVVELQCHGGIVLLQKVLELVLRSGARAAEPGEFTNVPFWAAG